MRNYLRKLKSSVSIIKLLWGLRIAWRIFNRKGVLAHASVCGYATILSLVPVLAISLAILSAFTVHEDRLIAQNGRFVDEELFPPGDNESESVHGPVGGATAAGPIPPSTAAAGIGSPTTGVFVPLAPDGEAPIPASASSASRATGVAPATGTLPSATAPGVIGSATGGPDRRTFSDQVFDFFFSLFIPGAAEDTSEEFLKARRDVYQFIERVSDLRFVSIILLILASVSLFNSIEHAFNEIWEVRFRRTLFTRFLAFWLLLTLTPLLLGLSYYYTSQLLSHEAIEKFRSTWFLDHAISYFFTLAAFLFANRYLPNVKVHFIPAFIASFLAAFFWEAAKGAFDLYMAYATQREGYYSIFGTLVAVPIFILWLYYSYLCFLIGPVIATTIQNFDLHLARMRIRSGGHPHRPIHTLRIFYLICEYFQKHGKGISHEELESITGWNPVRLNYGLKVLGQALLIHQGRKMPLYYPNADPDHLTVIEVVQRIFGLNAMSHPRIGAEDEWTLAIKDVLLNHPSKCVGELIAEQRAL